MYGPDTSDCATIVWKGRGLFFAVPIIGVLSYFLYVSSIPLWIYSVVYDVYADISVFIGIIIPGSAIDIIYIEYNRSPAYLCAAKLMFSITAIYFIFTYIVIIINVIRWIKNIKYAPKRSNFSYIVLNIIVYVFMLVWRTPGNQSGTMLLHYADAKGLYFMRATIAMGIGLFATSTLIANAASFAYALKKKTNQH